MIKYKKLRKKLKKEECESLISKSLIDIELHQEIINYWNGKNKAELSNVDLFIFLQSGFNTVEDYVNDCKNRIDYHNCRIIDMKERLNVLKHELSRS